MSPVLAPLSETTETLGALSEGSESLSGLAEGSETLTPLTELADQSTTHFGFFPGSVLQTAPYPFPSSISYPGDTVVVGSQGLTFDLFPEGTETLVPLLES